MLWRSMILVGLTLAVLAVGCSQSAREKDIEIKTDPLAEPRTILQRYAEGQPLGSEVTSFPQLVENVRKADPARAEILEKGFKEIEKSPAARAATAKGLLDKLK